MDHGFKLHPDGTLEITLPQGTKVGRVLVCEAGTQNGSLYYPEGDVHDINDENILSSQCHKNDLISRRAAIVQLSHNKTGDDDCDVVIQNDIETIKALPSAEPEPSRDVVDRATMLMTNADKFQQVCANARRSYWRKKPE